MATAATPAMSCCRCGLQRPKLRRCSKCKQVWYCGPDCQKKDWVAGHKITCGKKKVEKEQEEEENPNEIKVHSAYCIVKISGRMFQIEIAAYQH